MSNNAAVVGGPQGDQGDQGVTSSVQGDQGDQGGAGNQGDQGAQGPQGSSTPDPENLNFVDTYDAGTDTLYYTKVGKVYFNFHFLISGYATLCSAADVDESISNTVDRIAFKVGFTVDTYVTQTSYSTAGVPISTYYRSATARWTQASTSRPSIMLAHIIST